MREFAKTRREFLAGMAASAALLAAPAAAPQQDDGFRRRTVPADVTLRIAPVTLEIAPGRTIETIGYNGMAPGPLVRFREGVTATVDLFNGTDIPELVHWHGFEVPVDVDGAEEEGSLAVPARGHLRYRLTPAPAGFRYVHTHTMSMSNLALGTYSGQFAPVYVAPRHDPGGYDQEIFLVTHEWEPSLSGKEEQEDLSPELQPPSHGKMAGPKHGWEVKYRYYTINGKCLGYGEPIRVKEGERVLFHFLNASATESVRFALPGHRFRVVALDGNPVPHPQLADVLDLGTAERIDAIVQMDSPGVYVLGTPKDSHRAKGMGIVVEYAGRTGKPQWVKPPASHWDYTIFGESRAVPEPGAVIPLVIGQAERDAAGFERWTINGQGYQAGAPPIRLAKGNRQRLIFDNQTDDVHPVHLHRNTFELTNIYGTPTCGVMKDVVVLRGYQKLEVDVTPRMEGLTLFHCHQQLHMDYGFKLLFDVA